MIASYKTVKWIEDLADQDARIRAGEKASFDLCATKDEIVRLETVAFVRDLFVQFEQMVRIFNGRIAGRSEGIRLLRQGDGVDGLALTRGTSRLQIAKGAGVIQLQGEKVLTGGRNQMLFQGMIEAAFGPFNEVQWTFLGSPVTAEQVARHYLTDFIQMSSDQ